MIKAIKASILIVFLIALFLMVYLFSALSAMDVTITTAESDKAEYMLRLENSSVEIEVPLNFNFLQENNKNSSDN